jgi:hypothetical protein
VAGVQVSQSVLSFFELTAIESASFWVGPVFPRMPVRQVSLSLVNSKLVGIVFQLALDNRSCFAPGLAMG